MKKLTLKTLQLGAAEQLTREQMKNVLGASGSGGSGGSGGANCWCYHQSAPSPDPNGKDATCDKNSTISACCGSGYDGMNCW